MQGSVAAMERAVRFSFSISQALTRAPFSNMAPDFLVMGPEYRYKGYGGLLAAGFWNHYWGIDKSMSYVRCP